MPTDFGPIDLPRNAEEFWERIRETQEQINRDIQNVPFRAFTASPEFHGSSDGSHEGDYVRFNLTATGNITEAQPLTTTTTTTGTGDVFWTPSTPYGTSTIGPSTVGTVTIGPDRVPVLNEPITSAELLGLLRRSLPGLITPEPGALSEMIQSITRKADGQVVITILGPKSPSDNVPISDPEFIKRLDREIKAAIVRAFDLVIDVKKLQEFKRTLIVD